MKRVIMIILLITIYLNTVTAFDVKLAYAGINVSGHSGAKTVNATVYDSIINGTSIYSEQKTVTIYGSFFGDRINFTTADYNQTLYLEVIIDGSNKGRFQYTPAMQAVYCDMLDGYHYEDTLDNTDNQTLSYDTGSNILSITGGNTVDLSELDDTDTDDQTLSYNTATNILSISEGNDVNLTDLQDDVVSMVGNFSAWDKDYGDLINTPSVFGNSTAQIRDAINNSGSYNFYGINMSLNSNIYLYSTDNTIGDGSIHMTSAIPEGKSYIIWHNNTGSEVAAVGSHYNETNGDTHSHWSILIFDELLGLETRLSFEYGDEGVQGFFNNVYRVKLGNGTDLKLTGVGGDIKSDSPLTIFPENSTTNGIEIALDNNNIPELYCLNSAYCKITDNLEVVGQVNGTAFYDDGVLLTPDTNTQMKTDLLYLYNDSDTHYFNETKLNATIEALDTDTDTNTRYVGDNLYIYNTTDTMTLNETRLNQTIEALDTDTQLSGSDVAGMVGNFTAWDKDYGDLINTPTVFGNSTAEIQAAETDPEKEEMNTTQFTSNTTIADAFIKGIVESYGYTTDVDTDTNESTRFNELVADDCPANFKMVGVNATGGVLCTLDATGEGATDGNTNVTSIQVTGTTTKTFTLEQKHDGDYMTNLSVTFTDLTGSGGNSTAEMRTAINNSGGYVFTDHLKFSTDKGIKLYAQDSDVLGTDPQSIEFYNLIPDAKAYLGWKGWYENESSLMEYGWIGWLGCHYNTSINSDVHQHCSFETLDTDTGTVNTRWGLTYGKTVADSLFQFNEINYVLFSSGVDLIMNSEGTEYLSIKPNNQTEETNITSSVGNLSIIYKTALKIKDKDAGVGDFLYFYDDGTNRWVAANEGALILTTKQAAQKVKFAVQTDFQRNTLHNTIFEQRTSQPYACNSTSGGGVYWNTTKNMLELCDETSWAEILTNNEEGELLRLLADNFANISVKGNSTAEIQAAETDPTMDTEAEAESTWGSVNIILATEIDTSSELTDILGDEDGSGDCATGKICIGGHSHSDLGGNSTAEIRTAVNVSAQYNFYSSDLICTNCIDGTEIAELADADISNTLTCSDIVAGSSVVADAEVDDDITLTSSNNVTAANLNTAGKTCFSGMACIWWNGTALRIE